jgi:putative transcriptional regulator
VHQRRAGPGRGLEALRRLGAVSDLLFLYECATRDVAQLRTIADQIGVSVQAASHTFRGLARRGLAEQREGRYRPTVAGVDWLHSVLGGLHVDLADRLERLPIIRATHAVARSAIPAGASVVLAIEDGTLVARPGRRGPSRGVAQAAARTGELVAVEGLEGIVPLRRGSLRVVTLPAARISDSRLTRRLASELADAPPGLVAAQGLEAYHLVARAYRGRPVLRFGISAAVDEATQLGIDCTVVVLDREAPRFLQQFRHPRPPTIEFVSIRSDETLPRRRRRAPGEPLGDRPDVG